MGGGAVGGAVGGASRRDVPCAAPIGACGLSRRDRRWTLPWPRPTTSCFESASGASACGSRARASSARTGCSASRSTRSGKARCVRAACGCTGCSASRSTRSGKARWRWCAQVRPRGVAVSLQRGEEVCDGSNKFISTGRRPADCDQSTRDAAAKAIAEASAGPPRKRSRATPCPHAAAAAAAAAAPEADTRTSFASSSETCARRAVVEVLRRGAPARGLEKCRTPISKNVARRSTLYYRKDKVRRATFFSSCSRCAPQRHDPALSSDAWKFSGNTGCGSRRRRIPVAAALITAKARRRLLPVCVVCVARRKARRDACG